VLSIERLNYNLVSNLNYCNPQFFKNPLMLSQPFTIFDNIMILIKIFKISRDNFYYQD